MKTLSLVKACEVVEVLQTFIEGDIQSVALDEIKTIEETDNLSKEIKERIGNFNTKSKRFVVVVLEAENK